MKWHRPSIAWPLRRDLAEYVQTTPGGVMLVVTDRSERVVLERYDGAGVLSMDRATARLLARRLRQMGVAE